ncbi:tetratricopeptide repeat protein [Hymenobacter cellulosilyticus]|uniref:Tetratricopeptide repeat protein n=1 Tax=Hymenobacter cellulosilyticus TaxID=2932248 RepID=A0A8T9Q9V3_9BACT|nr:tetratricopeptide repeat protein [Hymenobacter cellulosilyticus]UOQ74307.1 tetratricopeptide repeat protein [Hymenobacter cellulosilyticus]
MESYQALDRVQLLLQHQRPHDAEQEARRLLRDDPDNSPLLCLLALAQMAQEQLPAAKATAEHAIHIDPENAFAFYVLSAALLRQQELPAALNAIEEALALNPEDADYQHVLGQIRFHQGQLHAALRAAEAGLAADPTHVDCLGLRARCLSRLGRGDEASANFDEALRQSPTDAGTHADLGWVALERGRAKEASRHFQEALRLNPTSEYAREGLVAALKSRFWLYSWFYRFTVWTQTMSPNMRQGLFIGLFLLSRLVPVLLPLYLVFVYMSWFAEPLFNSLLRFNRYGRYALSAENTRYSNQFLALLFSGLVLLGTGHYAALSVPTTAGIVALGLLFPLVGTQRQWQPKRKQQSSWFGWALAAAGVLAIVAEALSLPVEAQIFQVFLYGTLAYIWFTALRP